MNTSNMSYKITTTISQYCYIGVKPLIHQSELRTYTKVVPRSKKIVPFALLYCDKY